MQQRLWDPAGQRGAPTAPCQPSAGTLPLRAPPPQGADSLLGFREVAGSPWWGISSASLETRGHQLGERAPPSLGADANRLRAGIFGSRCQVPGGCSSLWDLRGPTVSTSLGRCFPPSPSCQKADDPSTRPPCCPRRPSRLSPSLRAHPEQTGRFACTLQGGEERAAAGWGSSPGQELVLPRGCPHSRG